MLKFAIEEIVASDHTLIITSIRTAGGISASSASRSSPSGAEGITQVVTMVYAPFPELEITIDDLNRLMMGEEIRAGQRSTLHGTALITERVTPSDPSGKATGCTASVIDAQMWFDAQTE